ncbi:hypothetical protein G9A89_005958 [Geosiphon pyriformis]|nr:hypothetical protein G9A89_005958 [Geosiphon pyriformis]
MKLSWARIDLVCCEKCGHFGHLALKCVIPDVIMLPSSKGSYKKSALEEVCFQLVKLYEKKCVSISCSAAFGGKFWAQIVSLSKSSSSIHSGSGLNFSFHGLLGLGSISSPTFTVFFGLSDYLVVLERSLELLADQMSEIMKKLSFVELVPLVSKSSVLHLVILALLNSVVDSDMAIDDTLASLILPPVIVADTINDLSLSSSKVLTSKVGGLESKLVALKVSVELVLENTYNVWGINIPAKQVDVVGWYVNFGNLVSFVTETKLRSSIKSWIANKFEDVHIFTSGLEESFLGAGVAVIMNNSLAQHMSKIEEVSGQVVLVQLLFKGKLSVTVLGVTKTETGNKGKQKVKQHSKTTPNTPILPKTTAKYLQTPEQRTSVKLPLSITLFPISLARLQTPNSPLNHFSRPEDFQSPKNPTQQQESISTSTNIIKYLQKNKRDHSENLESEKTKSEQGETTENKEKMATAYIAKISEFTVENNDTSP